MIDIEIEKFATILFDDQDNTENCLFLIKVKGILMWEDEGKTVLDYIAL